MQLKTIEIEGKTYAEVQDGKPLYDSDGETVAFDAPHAAAKIKALNGEAMGHRQAREQAEGALAAFEGISDPKAARAALETVKNFDDKKLVDAGEVEAIKAAAIAATEEKYKPYLEKSEKLESELRAERIGGSFARSAFIAEKLDMVPEVAEAYFGKHFSMEDGKTIAKDANGNQIYSKSRAGEPADFDEALAALVEATPFRDNILKGRGSSGGGAPGANGGAPKGSTMSRAAFDQVRAESPTKAAALMAEGISLTD